MIDRWLAIVACAVAVLSHTNRMGPLHTEHCTVSSPHAARCSPAVQAAGCAPLSAVLRLRGGRASSSPGAKTRGLRSSAAKTAGPKRVARRKRSASGDDPAADGESEGGGSGDDEAIRRELMAEFGDMEDIEAAGQQYLDDAPGRFDGTLPPVSDVSDAEMEREIKDLEDEVRRHKPLPRKKENKKEDKSKHPPPSRLPSLVGAASAAQGGDDGSKSTRLRSSSAASDTPPRKKSALENSRNARPKSAVVSAAPTEWLESCDDEDDQDTLRHTHSKLARPAHASHQSATSSSQQARGTSGHAPAHAQPLYPASISGARQDDEALEREESTELPSDFLVEALHPSQLYTQPSSLHESQKRTAKLTKLHKLLEDQIEHTKHTKRDDRKSDKGKTTDTKSGNTKSGDKKSKSHDRKSDDMESDDVESHDVESHEHKRRDIKRKSDDRNSGDTMSRSDARKSGVITSGDGKSDDAKRKRDKKQSVDTKSAHALSAVDTALEPEDLEARQELTRELRRQTLLRESGRLVMAPHERRANTSSSRNSSSAEGLGTQAALAPGHTTPFDERDKRTLFVGNVPAGPPLHRIKHALLLLAKPFGTVENMRFRSFAVDTAAKGPRLTKKEALARYQLAKHKPNMNAYIVFETETSARTAAVELNAYNFTMAWNVSGADDKTAMATANAARASNASMPVFQLRRSHLMQVWRVLRCDVVSGAAFVAHLSIFLGGLPFQGADEELIRRQFGRFGRIENVRLIRDKVTGLGKGFGYVQFDKESCVSSAVDAARAGTLSPAAETITPSRRSKYRNSTRTSLGGSKDKAKRTSGLVLKIGSKSYELRVMPAMKKTELTRHLKLRTFVNRGGADGLAKRTKRWRNRKSKRDLEKEGQGAGSPAPSIATRSSRTQWQQIMTKGQRKAFSLKVDKTAGSKDPATRTFTSSSSDKSPARQGNKAPSAIKKIPRTRS